MYTHWQLKLFAVYLPQDSLQKHNLKLNNKHEALLYHSREQLPVSEYLST